MSYAEHGPRIFLAGRPNTGMPLTYGDYVLPRKRLEGRLKLHDSCSDIRAWSPNSLENSRYIRELSEHDSSIGKIIPVNVVVDNIIRLNSHRETELQTVKTELQKYKNLKLTPKQEEQLQNLDYNHKLKESEQSNHAMESVNISKSVPIVNSNSCLSIHLPTEKHYRNTDGLTIANQFFQLCPYALNDYVQFRSVPKALPTGDYIERMPSWVEYIDIALQTEQETRDIGVQFDGQVDRCLNKITTISAMSQTSFIYKSSEEDNSVIELDKISFQTNNREEETSECDASCSESTRDIGTLSESGSEIGTESDFDINNSTHKGIIIQKDSEIIVLKNELGVRDAELDEVHELNKNLEILLKEKQDCINTQQENLKILHDKLRKLEYDRNCEIEDLKSKLHGSKYLVSQLKQDLTKKCESCYVQSQEIENLKLCAKEVSVLKSEQDLLLKKLQKMNELAEKAENCDFALDQLKQVSQEKDKLKKQNHEQSCMLADQEEEIKRLLTLIRETTVTYQEQEKTNCMLKNLKTEIHEKTIKISQYEQELISLKREIGDFVNNLKHALNNLVEFNGLHEDICNCANCDLDITEEANNLLYNINIVMTRFQSYKIERQNLLQQIQDLKDCVGNDDLQTYLSENLKNMISDVLNCESDTDPKNTNGKDSIIVLNVRQNKYNPSEIEFENISNSVHSEQSFNGIADNEYHNYIVKLDRKNNINEIDKELLEYFSHLMIKLQALTQKLQVYLEVERPQMIKQIYNFYEVLKDTESAINESQDLSLRKQRISELYDLYNEKYKNYETYVKQLPNDFSQIQVKIIEFIKTILHQLLNAILYVEKKNSFDKQINQAFEIHLRSCIDRISTALQGAGDRRIQIIEEIEKQQQELQKKDVEITQLKEEVEKQLLRRGEGDGLYSEESIAALKEQLTKLATELNVKDKFILNLREQQEVLRTELFKCNKDSNVLKMQNKNLDNIRDKLLKECEQYKEELEIKNKDVINLTQQLHNIFEIKNLDTEEKIKEMEKELLDLQFENNDLKNKIMQENKIISKKDDTIIQLKNQVERNEHILSFKIAEHKNEMEEKYHEIGNLKDENTLLNKKLKNAENRLSEMNQTILSLTEQNDKIDVIYLLQEDLVKLDKSEKKLKTELNNLKMQLTNDQNKVKKLDNSLNEFERENENLKKNVEYWRSENSVLSLKLSTEESEEKLRSKLYTLSSTIHERLLNFNKKINLEKHASNEQSDDSLKSKYLIYQNLTEEWKSRGNQKREIKENEVENAQNQQLINSTNIKYSSDDSLNIRYNTNHLKNGDIENQNETKNLRNDMEIKDSEMRNLEDAISRLTQENDDLRVHIKFQIQEYQDKLTLMKKNYDSSLNALCKRHKESVGTLQKRFEDIIKGERTFDSENWLQSLDIKKLTELYERITMVINNNSSFIHMKNENQRFYENDMQKEFYKDLNETEKTIHKNICEKDVSNKMASSILREQNTSYLQNQWQFIISSQTQKYPIQTEDYKLNLQQDFGLFDDRKLPRLENKHEKEKEAVKNNTLDQQRWSFINQCSAYHKMSNAVQDPFI